MRNKLLALLILPVIALTACSKSEPLPEEVTSAKDIVLFGELENDVYTNSYLGLSVDIPEGWHVQSDEENADLIEKGKDLVSSENEEIKDVIDASADNTAYLLTVFKYELGAPVGEFNPSFTVLAETVSDVPSITRGSDYLGATKQLLRDTGLGYEFSEGFGVEDLGGRDFDTMDSVLNYAEVDINQKYHTMINEEYAVSVIVSYNTEEQLEELEAVLETIDFE